MSLFGVLNRGTTGLFANQFGVETASQNAANVNTEGYTRRTATLEPLGPRPLGGVKATGSRRVIDQFLERRMLGARSFEGEASARARTLRVLDSVLTDGPGSIGDALDDFQLALGDLSASPHDRGAREVVLTSVDRLAGAFNSAANEVAIARADTNDRIRDEITQLNDKLHQIADLGAEIGRYENISQDEASDLRDRRDQLVREVSETVPVKVIAEPDGRISLLLSGSMSLVSPDGQVNELRAETDPTTADVFVHRTTAGADEDVTGLLTSGSIGGYVTARDGALTDAMGDLDQLAFDMAAAYNATHNVGFGLDGVSGRNVFEPLAGVPGAAAALAISVDIAGNPDGLAAATDAAALPGDNRNALDLLALADSDVALGGTATVDEGFQALIASAGTAMRDASLEEEHAMSMSSQLTAMRESVSGVSTDEEMISLMKYQRAYQASLQVIQTADEMLGDLIALKR